MMMPSTLTLCRTESVSHGLGGLAKLGTARLFHSAGLTDCHVGLGLGSGRLGTERKLDPHPAGALTRNHRQHPGAGFACIMTIMILTVIVTQTVRHEGTPEKHG